MTRVTASEWQPACPSIAFLSTIALATAEAKADCKPLYQKARPMASFLLIVLYFVPSLARRSTEGAKAAGSLPKQIDLGTTIIVHSNLR